MIEIKNLYFSYDNTSPYLLNNINLRVKKGDYISILGDNGSGKSTLIKLILNTVKPSKGKVEIKGSKIGYVPQRFESFNAQFPITVSEMINCHRKIIKLNNSQEVDKNLALVGMSNFKNSLLGNLSGGQQQKIFIARAILGNPEIIILDEPSTGVDIQSQEEIYSLVKELNVNLGITVISVEHNLKAALLNSDYIFELNKGNGKVFTVEEYNSKHQGAKNYAAV
jgi:zinc transport system ATP-binding protein